VTFWVYSKRLFAMIRLLQCDALFRNSISAVYIRVNSALVGTRSLKLINLVKPISNFLDIFLRLKYWKMNFGFLAVLYKCTIDLLVLFFVVASFLHYFCVGTFVIQLFCVGYFCKLHFTGLNYTGTTSKMSCTKKVQIYQEKEFFNTFGLLFPLLHPTR